MHIDLFAVILVYYKISEKIKINRNVNVVKEIQNNNFKQIICDIYRKTDTLLSMIGDSRVCKI